MKSQQALPAPHLAETITPHLASLIEAGNAADPIALQFLYDPAEEKADLAELADPIGDVPHSPVEGIVHREPDRVLLQPIRMCAAYCRFCFRREQIGPDEGPLADSDLDRALDYIRADGRIWEVILTGGDPLLLSPRRLKRIVEALSAIDHVGTIRFHTRLPIAQPAAITAELIDALASPKAVWGAIHCNHVREVTPETRRALARLVDAGIPLVSQTVLLKGINDRVETLDALFRLLVELRIKPYYLHHGDLARGTAHFRTTIVEGQSLLRTLRAQLSGLALPAYMLDIPGGAGKVPVGPVYLDGDTVTDPRGSVHAYGAG